MTVQWAPRFARISALHPRRNDHCSAYDEPIATGPQTFVHLAEPSRRDYPASMSGEADGWPG